MQEKNPFEHLRRPGIPDEEDIKDYSVITVYDDRREVVKILIADAGSGRYAFGYDLYFITGRHSFKLPTLEHGFCLSANNATLYVLGLFRRYSTRFTDNAMLAVNRHIGQYSQQTLFL